jgi:hypothetical protein
MALNGVVDAAVNGGVSMYSSFINQAYRTTNPEIAEDIDSHPHKNNLVEDLRKALHMQLDILRPGIEVHGRKCSEQMQPLHEHMKMSFAKLEVEMKKMLAS